MNENKSKFAGSGRQVSRICFGAWGLSGIFEKCSEAEMVRAVLKSLEMGVDFIDTARDYGDSEKIVGKALKVFSGPKPFVATKIQSKGPGMLRWGMPRDVNEVFPKGWITKCAEQSLSQLGEEKVDLIQLHLYWANWGLEGYWLDELEQLKDSGKTDFIGISVPDHRHDNALILANSGLIDSVQTVINIFDPTAFDSLVPLCQEKQVAVLARCVMDQGGLSGMLTPDVAFEASDLRSTLFPPEIRNEYMERVEALREYVPVYASSLSALAIKFVLAHPGVTSALISMHIPKFAEENLAVLREDPLPAHVFEEIRRHHRWTKNLFNKVYWKDGIYQE